MFNYNKLKGLIDLIRPELPFSAGVSVILGEIINWGIFLLLQICFLGLYMDFFYRVQQWF